MGSYPLSYSLATSVKASWVGPTPRKEMEMEGDSLLSDRPPPFFLWIFMKKRKESEFVSFFHSFFSPNDIRENVGWGNKDFSLSKTGSRFVRSWLSFSSGEITSWIFREEGKGYLLVFNELARAGKQFQIDTHQFGEFQVEMCPPILYLSVPSSLFSRRVIAWETARI